jgi:N-acyl-D-amino-acid deacylase
MYNLILSNAFIYDGLGNNPISGDIGIIGDKISKIGNLTNEKYQKKIDIKGLSVCPGFIDMHSHSDVNYFLDPYAECKIRQGVTTEVIGNCGGSAAPLYGEFLQKRKKEWEGLGIKIKWQNFKEYKKALKNNGIAVNVVPIIGHGNIRGAVKGYSTNPLTKRELNQMQKSLSQCMEEGAFGISTGLIYIPGMYADTKELIELVKIIKSFNGLYTTHMRSEGNELIESVKEALSIAEKAEVKLQISHIKTSGRRNWKKLNALFSTIETAIKNGIDVSCDRYPYIASNTDLDVLLPNWFHEMPYTEKTQWINTRIDELTKILKDTLDKRWAKTVMIGKINATSNFRQKKDADQLLQKTINTKTQNKYNWAEGSMLDKISKKLNLIPETTMIHLLRDADFQVQAMFFSMSEQNLKRILKKPYVMIGSDSSLRTMSGVLKTGHPHPRVFGTCPRVLSKYTGNGKLSMKEAINKMTGMPADKLGLTNRGRIKDDAFADIVIFDPKKIKDTATYEKPFNYPEGIETVIVNGEIAFNKGIMTKKLSGKVLTNV